MAVMRVTQRRLGDLACRWLCRDAEMMRRKLASLGLL
jgi:hypothetical protein